MGRSSPDPLPPFSDPTLLLSPLLLSLLCPLTERSGLRDSPGPPWASTRHTSQPHLGSLSPSCLSYHCQSDDCSPASPRLSPRLHTTSTSPLCSLAEWLHQSPPTWVPSRSSSSLGPKFKRSPGATNSSPCTSWPLVFPFPSADLLQALILNKNKARPKPNQKSCNGHRLFSLIS